MVKKRDLMTRKSNPPDATVALRKRAEKQAREGATESPKDLDALSPRQLRQMLHELQVHQIELAMQNDELRRTHMELEASRARYFDLYDLAPVGYCTLSPKGLILEGNLAAAALLGVERGALARAPLSRFIIKEDQDVYYLNRKRLIETGEPQSCDLRFRGKDGAPLWMRLQTTVAQSADGDSVCRAVMIEITARKEAELERAWMERVFATGTTSARSSRSRR